MWDFKGKTLILCEPPFQGFFTFRSPTHHISSVFIANTTFLFFHFPTKPFAGWNFHEYYSFSVKNARIKVIP
jgi:hypothetical protein